MKSIHIRQSAKQVFCRDLIVGIPDNADPETFFENVSVDLIHNLANAANGQNWEDAEFDQWSLSPDNYEVKGEEDGEIDVVIFAPE